MKEIDRRVRRTHRLLSEALLALMAGKSFDEITVQDITQQADLNRATFYLHYASKEELLIATLEEQFDSLVQQIEAETGGQRLWESAVPDRLLFHHVGANARLYGIILGQNSLSGVIHRILQYTADYVEKSLRSVYNDGDLPIPIPIIASHVAGSLFALVRWWLNNNMPYSPEEMADMGQQLCVRGMSELAAGGPKMERMAAVPNS